jgi:nucleoside-diphosphate-sugar epimerase
MRLLITGGCGHIGSYLIRNILNKKITVVDNLLTQRYTSLFNLQNQIKFSEMDIDELTVDDLHGHDIVLHLAAITDAAGSFGNKKEMEDVNITKTKVLIDKCIEAGVKKFIFPSSTSVYGVAADEVYEDESQFLNPQSPYAESKIEIENYLKESNIDYVIFRFGTIFGFSEGMRFHTAVNKFCYQSSLNLPLTIWKENYNQVRPYLGLRDCYHSIMMAIDGKLPKGVYNVVSENKKLSDIVGIVRKHNPNLKINFVDTPLLNQYSYNVSYEKIHNLGFRRMDKLKQVIPTILNTLYNLNG